MINESIEPYAKTITIDLSNGSIIKINCVPSFDSQICLQTDIEDEYHLAGTRSYRNQIRILSEFESFYYYTGEKEEC